MINNDSSIILKFYYNSKDTKIYVSSVSEVHYVQNSHNYSILLYIITIV